MSNDKNILGDLLAGLNIETANTTVDYMASVKPNYQDHQIFYKEKLGDFFDNVRLSVATQKRQFIEGSADHKILADIQVRSMQKIFDHISAYAQDNGMFNKEVLNAAVLQYVQDNEKEVSSISKAYKDKNAESRLNRSVTVGEAHQELKNINQKSKSVLQVKLENILIRAFDDTYRAQGLSYD